MQQSLRNGRVLFHQLYNNLNLKIRFKNILLLEKYYYIIIHL